MWTSKDIQNHKEAAGRLTAIARDVFAYLRDRKHATEGETKDFILEEIARRGLVLDKPFATPIVAFNDHAAEPHYDPRPGTRRLHQRTLVLVDIWARLRGAHMPYADITWMGYCGPRVPQATQRVFDTVLAARDACLNFVRRAARRGRLPVGRDAEQFTRDVIQQAGYGRYIRHSTGHALGFASPHGRGRHLNRKNRYPLLKNLGYTIEPGIYMPGRLGVRSEINFYVDRGGEVIVTTPMQKRLVMVY